MAFRLFLDLSLHSPLPDPSLLTYFRKRLGPEAHQQIFQDLIAQARQLGLVKDRAAAQGRDPRPGQYRGPLDLGPGGPGARPTPGGGLSLTPRSGWPGAREVLRLREATADLPDAERLVHRVAHLRTLVAWAEELLPPASRRSPRWTRAAAAAPGLGPGPQGPPRSRQSRGPGQSDQRA